jgi:hypothetical protein
LFVSREFLAAFQAATPTPDDGIYFAGIDNPGSVVLTGWAKHCLRYTPWRWLE